VTSAHDSRRGVKAARNRRRRFGYGASPRGMQAARRAFVMPPEVGEVKAHNGAAGPACGHTRRRLSPVRIGGQAGRWTAQADGTGRLAGAVDHSAPAAFGVAGGVW
jgi:hypothetical protein